MTNIRQKAAKVKYKRNESVKKKSQKEEAFEFCWSLFANEHHTLPKSTRRNENWTYLHLEPHAYQIYDVNIDLRHQYAISVAESQTFLLAKRPKRRGARRNGYFFHTLH